MPDLWKKVADVTFTDGKPHIVTAEYLKACWSGVPNAFLFRCKICGHVFQEGDTFRFIFGSHKRKNVGNVLVCSECDSSDESVYEQFIAMHEMLITRFWWMVEPNRLPGYQDTEKWRREQDVKR